MDSTTGLSEGTKTEFFDLEYYPTAIMKAKITFYKIVAD